MIGTAYGVVLRGGASALGLASGLSASLNQHVAPQRFEVEFEGGTEITLPGGVNYGGVKLFTFDVPMQFLSVSADLTFTHSGLAGDASTVQLGFGSQVAGMAGGDDVINVSNATGTTTGAWTRERLWTPSSPNLTEFWLNAAATVAAGGGGTPGIVTIASGGRLVLLAVEAADV